MNVQESSVAPPIRTSAPQLPYTGTTTTKADYIAPHPMSKNTIADRLAAIKPNDSLRMSEIMLWLFSSY